MEAHETKGKAGSHSQVTVTRDASRKDHWSPISNTGDISVQTTPLLCQPRICTVSKYTYAPWKVPERIKEVLESKIKTANMTNTERMQEDVSENKRMNL